MNDTAMDTSTVRSSPVSDGQQRRLTAVGKRLGLPHKLRMWPKKRIKTRLQILSLNGKGQRHERLEMDINYSTMGEKTSRNGVGIIVSQ